MYKWRKRVMYCILLRLECMTVCRCINKLLRNICRLGVYVQNVTNVTKLHPVGCYSLILSQLLDAGT